MSARELNFVKDGVSKLPPGFQFEPTDEEIVFQYLARKIFSYPLPASVIPEISSIGKFDPWELPGELDQDRYLFSNKENGNSTIKVSSGGYWKAIGLDKQITCSKWTPVVGIKKTFVFYNGKNSRDNSTTDWLMHQYHIALVGNTENTNSQEIGNWILCHVFLNKRNNKSDHGISRSSLHEFTSSEDVDSSSSYSDSSILTEVSSNICSDD